jgi:hypothetical protein
VQHGKSRVAFHVKETVLPLANLQLCNLQFEPSFAPKKGQFRENAAGYHSARKDAVALIL